MPKLSGLEEKVNFLLAASTSISTISTSLNKPIRSIYDAIYRIKKKKEDFNIKRVSRGRIEKLSSRDKRAINRDLTRSPKKVNKRLLIENNLLITKRTLQRFLKKEDYNINISSKKPYINKEKAKNRLIYAKEKDKNIENINFNKVIFSDESAIQRGHGARAELYRKKGVKKSNMQIAATTSRSMLF